MNGGMEGTFRLLIQPVGRGRHALADRRGLSWDEVCDLLKRVGDHWIIATVTREASGYVVMRLQPMGMFGPSIEGLELSPVGAPAVEDES